jgi:ribosome-binding protein aMBF1 (putative translation factor)
MTALEQFSALALVTRRRRDRGWSKHELAAAALMAESELCRLETCTGKIGIQPTQRRMAA